MRLRLGWLRALKPSYTTETPPIAMDILYLLIPLSVGLVLLVLIGLWWAVYRGQFENVDQEGERILRDS